MPQSHQKSPLAGKVIVQRGRFDADCRGASPPRLFQTDTEYPAMTHPLRFSIQACCADHLTVHLGKVLHIVRRSGLRPQVGLFRFRIKLYALRSKAEMSVSPPTIFRYASNSAASSGRTRTITYGVSFMICSLPSQRMILAISMVRIFRTAPQDMM